MLLSLSAVAIHECGHLVAAEYSTMQTMRMRILDFEFRRRRSGWSVRGRRCKHEPAGFVQAFPTDFDTVRRDYLRMIAAGPAANALASANALARMTAYAQDNVDRLMLPHNALLRAEIEAVLSERIATQ